MFNKVKLSVVLYADFDKTGKSISTKVRLFPQSTKMGTQKKINESTVANKDSPNKQVIFDAHTVKVHTQVVQPVNQYVN